MKTFKNFLMIAVSVLLAQIGWGQVPFTSTTAGAGTWTSNYDGCVTIELWGGGGGGGYKPSGTGAGGGGGGGGYVKFTLTVTNGATYNFSIGAGGTPVAGSGSTAQSGGDTWFSNSTFAVATGGKGGKNYNGSSNGTGGAGSSGNTVPVGGSGANGGNGSTASSSTKPGAGGEAGGANGSGVATNGKAAVVQTSGSGLTTGGDGGANATNGSPYGGGAGGSNATSGNSGGVGAIKITAGGSCVVIGCAHNGGVNTAANGSPVNINAINGTSYNNGQYIQVNGLEAGKTYTIHTTCISYVTIGTATTPKLMGGWSNTNYLFTLPGTSGITTSTTVYINLNSDDVCGTAGGPCQFYISCMDCDNTGGCLNATPIVTNGTYTGTTADNSAPNGTAGGVWPQITGALCGGITVENPEFYTFTATTTSLSFTFCGGCSTSGVQLVIFEIPASSSCGSGAVNVLYGIGQLGSATGSVYNCSGTELPATIDGAMRCVTGTVSLTPGKKYYIMVDGYLGATLGLCPFTLTFPSNISTLSIDLTSFTGNPADMGNELHWVTASEKNNDYFQLEATVDGQNFETVGRIKGAGNSSKKLEYYFLDRNPLASTTYYRLKQVDFDGETTYHQIIPVTRPTNNQVLLFPNPVNNELTVDINVDVAGNYTISFVSAVGNVVEQNMNLNKGYNRIHLNTTDLAKGFYLLKITDENGSMLHTTKLVKE